MNPNDVTKSPHCPLLVLFPGRSNDAGCAATPGGGFAVKSVDLFMACVSGKTGTDPHAQLLHGASLYHPPLGRDGKTMGDVSTGAYFIISHNN